MDKVVTMPYLRNIIGRNVQAVDDVTYAQHMLDRMQKNKKYNALEYVVNKNFLNSGQFAERIEHIQAFYLRGES